MDHDTRQFAREAKAQIRLLIEQCEALPACSSEALADRAALEKIENEQQRYDLETEVIMRSSMGGSANLAFFIPYLWRHRH